jgi:hypothetical protein
VFTALPGVTLGTGARDFALRGYPRSPARYTRVVTGVAELRIPLFLIGEGIWRLPVAVHHSSLTLFAEAGGAWAATGSRQLTAYRDLGVELAAELSFGDTPVLLRGGVARGLASWVDGSPGRTRWYWAIGPSF